MRGLGLAVRRIDRVAEIELVGRRSRDGGRGVSFSAT